MSDNLWNLFVVNGKFEKLFKNRKFRVADFVVFGKNKKPGTLQSAAAAATTTTKGIMF